MHRTGNRRTDSTRRGGAHPMSWLVALACAALLAGCAGGSGSSGFDAALKAENDAIDRAVESQSCQVENGLTVCASDTSPTPSGSPTPSSSAAPTRSSTATLPPSFTATQPPASFTPTRVPASFTPTRPPPSLTATPATLPSEVPETTATPTMPGPHFTATTQASPTGGPDHATTTPTQALTSTASSSPTDSAMPTERATATASASPTDSSTPTPVDSSTPTDSPTPTATPPPAAPNVDTNVGPQGMISCQPGDTADTCLFVFSFNPEGFPPGAAYRVGVRTRNPDGAWKLLSVSDNNDVAVSINPHGPDYQFAVLIYLEAPAVVPAEVELLAFSGADFAFVTPVQTPEVLLGSQR